MMYVGLISILRGTENAVGTICRVKCPLSLCARVSITIRPRRPDRVLALSVASEIVLNMDRSPIRLTKDSKFLLGYYAGHKYWRF